MDQRLVVATTPITHPDAVALIAEMVAEVATLYGRPDAQSPLEPTLFDPPDGRFLVAYLDGQPVGCIGYRRVVGELAQVHRVFVRPAGRGAGLGRQLMELVEQLARDAGYTTLRLHTGPRQPAARRIYEDLGWTPIPLFAPYENDPLSLCYAKRIG